MTSVYQPAVVFANNRGVSHPCGKQEMRDLGLFYGSEDSSRRLLGCDATSP
jgi:hypothetical protein